MATTMAVVSETGADQRREANGLDTPRTELTRGDYANICNTNRTQFFLGNSRRTRVVKFVVVLRACNSGMLS